MKTRTEKLQSEVRKKSRWAAATAIEHAAADKRCGREWECACGACGTIRAEIAHQEALSIAHRSTSTPGFTRSLVTE
jgi:hypothetical protein